MIKFIFYNSDKADLSNLRFILHIPNNSCSVAETTLRFDTPPL